METIKNTNRGVGGAAPRKISPILPLLLPYDPSVIQYHAQGTFRAILLWFTLHGVLERQLRIKFNHKMAQK